MNKTKILVAQLGARKHYQEPVLFKRWGILAALYTDFYSGDGVLTKLLRHNKIYKYLANFLKKALERYQPDLQQAKIFHFPPFAYEYLKALKKVSPTQASQIFIWAGQEFSRLIIKNGFKDANVIYGFNSACLELFQYAKTKGIVCILDQTLVDYSLVYELLLEEEKLWPQWSLTPFSVSEFDFKLMLREHCEQDLADKIICGSSFVKHSLIARGVDANKITVVPLANIKVDKNVISKTKNNNQNQLNILFVGSVNLRKGIPYLLEALKQINAQIPFVCKVAGSLEIKPERIAEYSNVCEFLGRVPRSQVKDLYAWADVFVLPSLCEGSAMAIYEALSFGVPVITTENSGSIVRDGIDGLIVPIRSVEAIAEALSKIYHQKSEIFIDSNTEEHFKAVLKQAELRLKEAVTTL